MPRLPQRSCVFAALRPLGAAVAAIGVALAIASSSAGSAAAVTADRATGPVATVPQAGPSAGASRPVAPEVRVTAPHTARSQQRTEWVRPVPGPVTSWFGRRWGALHPGIDLGSPYGTPVHAITSGWILSAGGSCGCTTCGSEHCHQSRGGSDHERCRNEGGGDTSALLDGVLRHAQAETLELGDRDVLGQRLVGVDADVEGVVPRSDRAAIDAVRVQRPRGHDHARRDEAGDDPIRPAIAALRPVTAPSIAAFERIGSCP